MENNNKVSESAQGELMKAGLILGGAVLGYVVLVKAKQQIEEDIAAIPLVIVEGMAKAVETVVDTVTDTIEDLSGDGDGTGIVDDVIIPTIIEPAAGVITKARKIIQAPIAALDVALYADSKDYSGTGDIPTIIKVMVNSGKTTVKQIADDLKKAVDIGSVWDDIERRHTG